MDNRLASINTPNGSEVYAYSSANQRLRKQGKLYFYGVSGELLVNYDFAYGGSGTTPLNPKTQMYFGGMLVFGEGDRRLTMDRLGSTVRTEGYFQPEYRYRYYPYGEQQGGSSNEEQVKFGTYWRDSASGLDYAQNRYFAASQGRFTSADPNQASGVEPVPQSWNRYAYVKNDPANYSDPTGLDAIGFCLGMTSAGIGSAQQAMCAMMTQPKPSIGDLYNSSGLGLGGAQSGGGGAFTGSTLSELAPAEANHIIGTVVPGYVQGALDSNPVITQAVLPPGAVSATITYGQAAQGSGILSALTVLPQMFWEGWARMLLNDDPRGALEVAESIAYAVGPQAVANAFAPATLYHFTTSEAAAAITSSGTIYPSPGLFGWGVYGSAIQSGAAARIMGAASVDAVVSISGGLGTAASGLGPLIVPGAYRVITPLTIFGGVIP